MTNEERIEYLRIKAEVIETEVTQRTNLYGHTRPIDEAFTAIAKLAQVMADFIEDYDSDH